MVIKNCIKGIVFVVLILSIVYLAMAAALDITITVTSPANNSKINGTSALFAATVADSVDNITQVEFFYRNDTIPWTRFLNNTYLSPPGTYAYPNTTLNTKNLANGTYRFNVTVTDDNLTAINTKSETVFFEIDNPLPAQQEPSKPALTSWRNNKTNDDSLIITINKSETIVFNATSNQTIDTWNWLLNGSNQNNNFKNFSHKFDILGNHIVEVNATNSNGTSNTIPWNIQVITQAPGIISRGNNKTNDASSNITVNRTETVVFNATANQTIDTWNWFVNGTKQNINFDNFSYQFNAAGTHKIKVNATNENGTSNNVIWSVDVSDNTPPTNITNLNSTSGFTWIKWTWTNPTADGDFDHTEVYLNSSFVMNTTNNNYNTSTNFTLNYKTTHTISLRPVDTSGNIGNWTNGSASTTAPPPRITRISPPNKSIESIGIEAKTFTIKVEDQIANITWKIGDSVWRNYSVLPGALVNITYTPPAKGIYNVSVNASNENGTSDTIYWNWTVRPRTYKTGNRIWDASKEMSPTYTWNTYSFSGFYYNLKGDLGTEEITISNIDRSIAKGEIQYKTSPQEVSFEHSGFGRYEVIGFMADKYFAGYTANTNLTKPTESVGKKSALSSGQLHKVLIDDDTKRTVSEGGTLTLKEGYVLKVKAVDVGAGPGQIWVVLLKDGNEVDPGTTLTGGSTYVYKPGKVGSVSELPIIFVYFESVFRGREVNAAFIKGVFQISDTYTQVKSGTRYGAMEITGANENQIKMENKDTIDLSKGSTKDLMGNLKIIVANNDTLRFGLSSEQTGTFEVRGTIYNATDEWTPMNFGMNIGGTSIGFYYDMDEDIGNEKFKIEDLKGKSSIGEGKLEYATSPQEVSFKHGDFGRYEVIGFMAEKYFAGYTANTKPTKPTESVGKKSALSSGQLHKVLIDDDTKRTVSEGGTLTLKEGYVLKVKAVDVGAGPGQIWVVLLKDGNEVDPGTTLTGGSTYVYKPSKVGSVSELPIIFVYFESVFRGREVNAAFIKGVFQISDTYTQVKSGKGYGAMEIESANENAITMKNKNSISLSSGSTSGVMGNIKFRVAESTDVRFYPFVEVTQEMVANQIVIDAPGKASAGDAINIKVTAGGSAVEGAAVTLDSEIGSTNTTGVLNYTLPRTLKGIYNITATKLGYQKAIKSIEVLEYIEYRLSIDAPAKANQFEAITIKVSHNDTPVSIATLLFDNTSIGVTDANGTLNYTLEVSGTHTITASKSGYITAVRDIDIRMPFSEYKALDINISPSVVFTNEEVVIRSNITNVGTKADTLPVELIINGSVVDIRSVSLAPNEIKEINFTRQEALPGNYTVEILGQKGLLEVREEPLNFLLIGGIATGFGALIIYLLTAKSKISLELLRQKLSSLGKSGKKVPEVPVEKK